MKIRFVDNIHFCPFCGVATLTRDNYQKERPREPGKVAESHNVEFICETCLRGFRICASTRETIAQQLFADHRKMRVGKGYSCERS